jgi:hypothetical protein
VRPLKLGFKCAALFEIGIDVGRAKYMESGVDLETGVDRASADRLLRVHPVHRVSVNRPVFAPGLAEEGVLPASLIPAASRYSSTNCSSMWCANVSGRSRAAAPTAFCRRVIILDLHGDDGADAREAISHHADQRPIVQGNPATAVEIRMLVKRHLKLDDNPS